MEDAKIDGSGVIKQERLSAREKISYAAGDTACLCVFGLVGSLLQKYYTDILYIRLEAITVMFIIARIWDAINDPIWGRFVDTRKINPTYGRYRKWMMVMSIPLSVSAILMFVKIPGLSHNGYLTYAYFTYILFGMLYTTVNITYGSLSSVMTMDESERSTLSVFRSIGSGIGGLPAMIIASVCYVTILNDDGTSSKVMSYEKLLIGVIIASVASCLLCWICFKNTKERYIIPPKPKKEKHASVKLIISYIKSRPFMSLCLGSIFLIATQMFMQTYYAYILDYYFNREDLYFLVMVCTYLPIALVMFFMNKLIKLIGKKSLCAFGLLFASIANLVLFFIQTQNIFVFLSMCFLSGIGSTFFLLEVWAMVNDVIDLRDVSIGERDEATSYAFFSFTRKLGHAVAGILSTQGLKWISYNAELGREQADNTITGMYNVGAIVPAILFFLGFVVLWFIYPLNKRKTALLQTQKFELMDKRSLENDINTDM
ncbi:MAG: glycoside-pentoside-hexuronide (GPH):cation symporter [Christensenellaceae bacterium]|jgi:GPH family glycoside/pentoside/hexuronide:cation symporter|nr:glycoside-pentoside-hexuronide (GPH):cation symporter [Christensenellaceae bacterium]